MLTTIVLVSSCLLVHAICLLAVLHRLKKNKVDRCAECGYSIDKRRLKCPECGAIHAKVGFGARKRRAVIKVMISAAIVTIGIGLCSSILSGTWAQLLPDEVVCRWYYASEGKEEAIRREFESRYMSTADGDIAGNERIVSMSVGQRRMIARCQSDAGRALRAVTASSNSHFVARQLVIVEMSGFDDRGLFETILNIVKDDSAPSGMRIRAACALGGASGDCAAKDANLLTSAVRYEGMELRIAREVLISREKMAVPLSSDELPLMRDIADQDFGRLPSSLNYLIVARRLIDQARTR